MKMYKFRGVFEEKAFVQNQLHEKKSNKNQPID
jgi:hypothetical protein